MKWKRNEFSICVRGRSRGRYASHARAYCISALCQMYVPGAPRTTIHLWQHTQDATQTHKWFMDEKSSHSINFNLIFSRTTWHETWTWCRHSATLLNTNNNNHWCYTHLHLPRTGEWIHTVLGTLVGLLFAATVHSIGQQFSGQMAFMYVYCGHKCSVIVMPRITRYYYTTIVADEWERQRNRKISFHKIKKMVKSINPFCFEMVIGITQSYASVESVSFVFLLLPLLLRDAVCSMISLRAPATFIFIVFDIYGFPTLISRSSNR